MTDLNRDNAELLNEVVETAYWKFAALRDPTQTQTPLSERDAFKNVVFSVIAASAELTLALRRLEGKP